MASAPLARAKRTEGSALSTSAGRVRASASRENSQRCDQLHTHRFRGGSIVVGVRDGPFTGNSQLPSRRVGTEETLSWLKLIGILASSQCSTTHRTTA